MGGWLQVIYSTAPKKRKTGCRKEKCSGDNKALD
jgi:hypothetical protein